MLTTCYDYTMIIQS